MRLLALVLVLASCQVTRPTFKCATWEDCGPGGACEPVEEACSFLDDSCKKSGRRFSSVAPAPFHDQCVELRPDAPATALCDPDEPTCDDFRECVGNRCVSTRFLEMGKKFACGRCATTLAHGPVECWGDLAILGPTDPVGLIGFGYIPCVDASGPTVCPPECSACTAQNQRDPAVCPVTCLGIENVEQLTIGENHVCWIFGGRMYCAGSNADSALGFGSPDLTIPQNQPGLIVRLANTYNRPAAGGTHTCAIGVPSERVFCWGNNVAGQLTVDGRVTAPSSLVAESITTAGPVFPFDDGVQVGVDFLAASNDFTCASSNNDRVRCWGTVPWGAGFRDDLPPGPISDLDVGAGHACVVKNSRAVCWGNNRQGQADPSAPSMMAAPTIVLDEEVSHIVTGRVHTCAITKRHGAVWCWGAHEEAQLDGADGPGPVEIRSQPPAVGPIAAGDDVTCAIHADDRIRCWGDVFQNEGITYNDFEICVRDFPDQ